MDEGKQADSTARIFDNWSDQYDAWFETPVGRYVKHYEAEILNNFMQTVPDDSRLYLDAGCGSGIFTQDIVYAGSHVIGVDISLPMLSIAHQRLDTMMFSPAAADMLQLPFSDEVFDVVVSMTAIEFIQDGHAVVNELFRVAKPGSHIIVSTLNSRSPWAKQRKQKGEKGHTIFQKTVFRSPEELLALAPVPGEVRTAVHFQKDTPIEDIPAVEEVGKKLGLSTGAFVAAKWLKPCISSKH